MNPRTCIGCRQRAEAGELIRIVVDVEQPGRIRVDRLRRLAGRGAYLHPSIRCFEAATRRRAFGRALRAQAVLDTTELEQYVVHEPKLTVRNP